MAMWKKVLLIAAIVPLMVLLAMPLAAGDAVIAPREVSALAAVVDDEMRGVWVSGVLNLDYPLKPTADAAALKKQADNILDGAKEMGLNTVFLQVRPCADAYYDSEVFPWSVYLTGEQGKAPEGGLDPLEYWIDGAHKRGLELHAWINPYRITRSAAEWDDLAADSPARRYPAWTVEYKDNYYFNPALPEVRQLVIDGALELVENYDVDGIHLDDYFYPGTDFDDEASFAAYGGDFANIDDWRRENVNMLVRELDRTLHAADANIRFGISPAGVWASDILHPQGSDTTTTFSSYFGSYADSKKWVEEGWVDYIVPQIYWERGHSTADFNKLLEWWTELAAKNRDVDLYIGLADYKTLEAKGSDSPWYEGAEIAAQIKACAAESEVDGTVHFRYGSLANSKALQRVLQAAFSADEPDTLPTVTPNEANGNGEVSVWVDGRKLTFDEQPFVQSGRVMLPMRVIFEEIGATVNWWPEDKRIVASKQDVQILLHLGSDEMWVAGKLKHLDVPAFAQNGRTLLPLRAVAEALDCTVDWNNSNKTVTITT